MRDDEQRRKGGEAYAVGFGKPPFHTRFKPGQSGNPKGRPKNSKSYKEAVGAILNEKIKVRMPQGTKRITKLEALVYTNVNNALKGDPKATGQVFRIAREVGLVEEVTEVLDKVTMEELCAEDKAILERLSVRRRGDAGTDDDE